MHREPHHQPMEHQPMEHQPMERRSDVEPNDELPPLFFDPDTTADLEAQWSGIQTSFVDDPRSAVAKADALVDEAIGLIARTFDRGRRQLEAQWGQGDASTEDLRICLMRYRSFFHRLLSSHTTAME